MVSCPNSGKIYKYEKSNCIQAGFIKIAGDYVIFFYYLRSLSCMALIIEIFICVVTIFQQNTLQIWYYSNQGKTERNMFAMTPFHALAKCRSFYLVIHSALHLH